MSVVPAPTGGRVGIVLRAAAVTLAWLATVLVTAIMCRPWPGTELLPVIVAVAMAVVMLVGRPVGGALVLFTVTVLAQTLWGPAGGAVLVAATIAALALLPVHAVQPTPGRDQ
ncbi:hypothetical protein [Nonomuraea bangladeshensis]|uniref:hypothetical protein n=1 Tax=Nonomuraea bangladeshensis TaxID=404385 RepID=UPI0031D16966